MPCQSSLKNAEITVIDLLISHINANCPQLGAEILRIPEETLVEAIVTDNQNAYDCLGLVVLRAALSTFVGMKYPNESLSWYETVVNALSSRTIRQLVVIKQGIFRGALPKENKTVANTFSTFVCAYWRQYGTMETIEMVARVFKDSLEVAALAILSLEYGPGTLPSTFNIGRNPSRTHTAGTVAAIRALYALRLSPSQEASFDLRPDAVAPPSDLYALRVFQGMHYLGLLVTQVLLEAWPDAPSMMVEILSGDILNRDVLHHIPHFLHHVPQLHADDHLLVYQWSGCYVDVSAIDEGRIREFARVLFLPMFEAARAARFPFYLANAAIPRDDAPKLIVNVAVQHIELYYIESKILRLYQPLVADVAMVDDCQDIATAYEMDKTVTYDDAEQPDDLLKEVRLAREAVPRPRPSHVHVIAYGYDTTDPVLLTRLAERSVAKLSNGAKFLRLSADPDGKPNGGAIFQIHETTEFAYFRERDLAGPFVMDDLHIMLSKERPAIFDAMKGYTARMRSLVTRTVSDDTLRARGILGYKCYLVLDHDPLLPRSGDPYSTLVFGHPIPVLTQPNTVRGYAADNRIPKVPRCGVQFCANDRRKRISRRIECVFKGSDKWDVLKYDAMMDGESRVLIICNRTLPQSFVDNLNATRPRLQNVEGTWSFIPEGELQLHVIRIARQKAGKVIFSPDSNAPRRGVKRPRA
ncbi:hypothetical protein EV714DRAFT_222233 [Schizophyllum commune]